MKSSLPRCAALVTSFFLMLFSARAAEAVAEKKPEKKVLAHYMCWFENRPSRTWFRTEHWSYKLHGKPHDAETILPDGKHDISSIFYPLIGIYDSNDPDVIEYHVLSAKAAGIDGFVIDWYQPGSVTDVALQELAEICPKYKFSFAACYEEKAAFPGYRNPKTRDDSVKLGTDDFTYLLKTYGATPGYFRIDGKPAVFMFLGGGQFAGSEAVFNYMELKKIKDEVNFTDWVLFREHVDPTYWTSAKGAFQWIGDENYQNWFGPTANEQKKKGRLDYVTAAASPGFDSSGVAHWGDSSHPVIERAEGKYYAGQWERAIKMNPDLVQIVTWNDFQEGSIIEPTFQFKNKYLDQTEEMVAKFNGRKVDLTDNGLAFKIFQLRKAAAKKYGKTGDDFKSMNQSIDQAALALADGKTAEVNKLLDETSKKLEWTWLAEITADKEFGRYMPQSGKDKELTDAYELIKSPDNIAKGKTVTVSSTYVDPADVGGNIPKPEHLTDGDWSKRWGSDYKDGQWVKIDLGESQAFSKIILDWESAFAKAYSIEVSDDDTNWKSIYSIKDFTGGLQVLPFESTKARYIRINLIDRATSWGFSLWEIGVLKAP